ncbi:MAG: hypothetical protein P0119_09670 [Nitrospira sp.]|nr:hypothetical protein [Nitrospira sp.]
MSAIGFLYGATEGRYPAMLGARQTTNGEDALGCGNGIVCGIDLSGARMEFA